ncbi:MAG: serine/threonine-protein kinase [Kofleriaceae bacterium]|nr:serine/threonine-protein kinase [Kofleriaceae bacterium]
MFCPTCHAELPANRRACPTDGATLLRSSQIGKYTILAPLGMGGMGAVYRAINPDTKGEVAIKLMHDEAARLEPMRARFKREAAAIAKLKTSHVVKVYDFGAESDGTLYLVMELIEGHALRAEIQAPPNAMELARVQFVIDGVLKGLSAAHRAGIVHRDLKPENIVLAKTDDGELPQIIDFGIARIESPEGALRSGGVTRPGMVMGTLVYMAPEQLEGTVSQVGKWSDVYAVGAMMFEMFTGKTQVKDGTHVEVVVQHRRRQHPKLEELRPDLPPALCEVVGRCLEVDLTKRPQDADEMRAALAEVWGGSGVATARPVARTRPKTYTNEAMQRTVATEPGPTVPDRPELVAALAPTLAPDVGPDVAPVVAAPKRRPVWIVYAAVAALVVAVIVAVAM